MAQPACTASVTVSTPNTPNPASPWAAIRDAGSFCTCNAIFFLVIGLVGRRRKNDSVVVIVVVVVVVVVVDAIAARSDMRAHLHAG